MDPHRCIISKRRINPYGKSVATLPNRLSVAKWSIELRPRPDVSLRPLRPHEVSDRYVDGINDAVVARFLVARKEGKLSKESISASIQKDWEASILCCSEFS